MVFHQLPFAKEKRNITLSVLKVNQIQTANGVIMANLNSSGANIGFQLASNLAPAFSAYPSAATSISNSTWLKLTCDVEDFDTNSNYNTSNYRFTPTVAGYYQVSIAFSCSANCPIIASLWRNGAEYRRGVQSGATNISQAICSALVYLNGSTDYIEGYGYQSSGTTQTLSNSYVQCYYQAAMIRSA